MIHDQCNADRRKFLRHFSWDIWQSPPFLDPVYFLRQSTWLWVRWSVTSNIKPLVLTPNPKIRISSVWNEVRDPCISTLHIIATILSQSLYWTSYSHSIILTGNIGCRSNTLFIGWYEFMISTNIAEPRQKNAMSGEQIVTMHVCIWV